MIPEGTDFSATQGEASIADSSRKAISSNSKTSWSRLKDPRIVRVSKAFGGKDRHSKVYTVRGLRDRRVRLSVQTAIQLYDLQDRLGLNQPSKVVDWLLNEAKDAIDELPPLQIPQGILFGSQSLHHHHHHHPMFMYDSQQQHHHEFLSAESDRGLDISRRINWGKGKDVSGETSTHGHEDSGRTQEEERSQLQLMSDENQAGGLSSSNTGGFLSRQSVSFQGLLNGSLPQNPFFRHELSTSQTNNEDLRRHHHNSFSLVQLPSIPSVSHPFLVYHQPGISSYFDSGPFKISGTNTESESKRGEDYLHSSLQPSNSSLITPPVESDSQPVRAFQFTADLLPSQNGAVDEQNNNCNQFHSS